MASDEQRFLKSAAVPLLRQIDTPLSSISPTNQHSPNPLHSIDESRRKPDDGFASKLDGEYSGTITKDLRGFLIVRHETFGYLLLRSFKRKKGIEGL